MSQTQRRFNLHQTITDKIVQAIERVSAEDFRLPWHRTGLSSIQPKNALTKNAYRGINVVSLWVAAEVGSYPHALWASYKQWNELGAQVKKAEKSSIIIFYKEYDVEPDSETEDDDGRRLVVRYSNVFNVAQVENFTLPDMPATSVLDRDHDADAFHSTPAACSFHSVYSKFFVAS